MPRILILGATGYLGNNIANLLVRSGQHRVFGLARSPEKANQLARQEIIPVLCPDPVNTAEPYLSVIRSEHIDVVLDVAGANQASYNFLRDITQIGRERLATYKSHGTKGPKLGFIYCSGTWVHGSSDKPVNDLDLVGSHAVTRPPELVAWRVDLEKAILKSTDVLDAMILRPALIYGRELGIWSTFITPILTAARDRTVGPIQVPLDSQARPGLIHVDDVATAFQKAIEKLPLISGTGVYPVFDLVTSQESMQEIIGTLATCWGFRGAVELKGHGDNAFADALSSSFHGSSARAKQLLDWEPMRLDGFVKDMDLYAAAFAATK
jgi:nucleoside-diphosphate-sugar epimerase